MANEIQVIRESITKMVPEFRNALPAHIAPEKFVRTVLTSVQTNPDLVMADKQSLFASATKCAQDGLLPDGREAAFFIFNSKDGDRWVKKVQYMPMVQGLVKKLRNSGEVNGVTSQLVYKNDKFSFNPALDMVPNHSPDWFADRGEMIGAYAVIEVKDSKPIVEIMTKAQIDKIRACSKSKDSGPWAAHYEEMARKTVIRRACKYAPSSAEIDQVFSNDDEQPAVVADYSTVTPESKLELLEQKISSKAETPPVKTTERGSDLLETAHQLGD